MKPLRLWPGAIAAVLIVLVRLVLPLSARDGVLFGFPSIVVGVLGGVVSGLAAMVWWVFFSRAPWLDRVGAIVLMIGAALATSLVIHPSIANGHMGMMFPLYIIPLLGLALVVSAAASRRLSSTHRRASMLVAILIACAAMAVVRTGGISGEGEPDLHWRWSKTHEERLVAQPAKGDAVLLTDAVKDEPPVPARVKSKAEWPGFRGPGRDSVIHGVRIDTNWAVAPPVEIWRRSIGPGWSSFAVAGDLIYTQEQRGDDEMVSCHRLKTGEPVWRHRDPVRFYESNAGPGPRATPVVHDGRVFTMGATGIVNALDAATGAVVWSRNAATDTGKKVPDWGFTSSPAAIGDLVIVAADGQLIAYDAATGKPRWVGESGGGGYSSPHLATLDGMTQILLQRGARTISVAPADGTLLWEYSWVPSVSIVQPALMPDGVLITSADAMGGQGMKRLAVARGPSGWTVEERWTSRGLKPYFNDFVVHKEHVFGFDGSILSCIDLKDGERKWKGGRYGSGQLVLLSDQDVLLVLSEDGELALVSATPEKFSELARHPAIEGKTWNHPVLVGDVLLVRNGEEMAAFRLPLAGR
jgi:outer membrane protein assembly factor BamB